MPKRQTDFTDVVLSLADVAGLKHILPVCKSRAYLTGESPEALQEMACEKVSFFPEELRSRLQGLLPCVGRRVGPGKSANTAEGASTEAFNRSTSTAQAPLSGLGYLRIGEDGRLYLITKSEHYHAALGHSFPGYQLIERARRLGIPNATHNNTRGHITRQLEEELICAANGISRDDLAGLERLLRTDRLDQLNRALNLETGSLAVEAALKMVLSRFYRFEDTMPEAKYQGRRPVLLVMGDDDGGLKGNYHGTTVLTQVMRGMWPEFAAELRAGSAFQVEAIRPNNVEDLDAAFSKFEQGEQKIAGFFHEIVMMNYGGLLLTRDFLQHAYALCAEHDVPTVADEIQSCMWEPGFFLFREYGLHPSFVAVGKGFPGGEYPASRILFSSAMDDQMPQFGALVTNGQEELASLAYLVTMRWAEANGAAIGQIGDYYHERLRELAEKFGDVILRVEGRRHLSTLFFHELETARDFTARLRELGLDVSAQTYKAECPPAVLTKLPLIAGAEVVDFIIERMEQALTNLA
jgi:acetylornithine/succinyldiaminopimelate/putrescine aminotransferase